MNVIGELPIPALAPDTVVDTEKSGVAVAGALSVNVNDDPPLFIDNADSPVPTFVDGVKSETNPVVNAEPDLVTMVHVMASPTRTGYVASTQLSVESVVGLP